MQERRNISRPREANYPTARETDPIDRGRGQLATGSRFIRNIEDKLVCEVGGMDDRLVALPQMHGQLSRALALGQEQLLQNSKRLQDVVADANCAGRRLVQQQLQALGVDIYVAKKPRVAADACLRRSGVCAHERRSDTQDSAGAQRTQEVQALLKDYVEQEVARGEAVRSDVSAQTEVILDRYRQWLEFFRIALEVVQGQQRHEVERTVRLIEARHAEATTSVMLSKERVARQISLEESILKRSVERNTAAVSDYVQRRRCDVEMDVMSRDQDRKDLIESHNYDIERQKLALQERRNDQDFISSIICHGLHAVKAAVL